jgi:outer membrane murein-binding lipoprotein Lpp
MTSDSIVEIGIAIVSTVGTIASSIFGFLYHQVSDDLKTLENKLEKLDEKMENNVLHLATHYAPKSEVEAKFDKIENQLDKLESKVDNLAQHINDRLDAIVKLLIDTK